MKKSYIECDNCKTKFQIEPILIGGNSAATWLRVTRTCSDSESTISAGEHHFCSEKCLRKFLK